MIQILNLLFTLLHTTFSKVICALIDISIYFIPEGRSKKHNADFIDPEKVLIKGSRADGFHISDWGTDVTTAFSHMIAFGGSGSFKSSAICHRTLLESHDFSYVVHDCSYQLFNETAAAKKQFGTEPLIIDYASEHTECFNYLQKAKSHQDIIKSNDVYFSNAIAGERDYWYESALQITNFFSKLLWSYADPRFVNMGNVLHMINVFSYASSDLDKWIVKHANEQELSEYKALVATPQKTLQCSLSSAKTALALFADPHIRRITSTDTISFDSFRTSKKCLFLCNSPANAYYYRALNATFVQCFFNHLLEKLPSRNEDIFPVMFLLDECAVMRLQLSSFLALSRKYSVAVATIWQDFNQIEHIYGKHEAANIFANSNLKAFMAGGKSVETCVMLERLMGRFEFLNESGQVKTKELLTAQEINQLNKILVLHGNKSPMLLDVRPHFQNTHLRKLSELPTFEPKSKLPTDTPPLMKFG